MLSKREASDPFTQEAHVSCRCCSWCHGSCLVPSLGPRQRPARLPASHRAVRFRAHGHRTASPKLGSPSERRASLAKARPLLASCLPPTLFEERLVLGHAFDSQVAPEAEQGEGMPAETDGVLLGSCASPIS